MKKIHLLVTSLVLFASLGFGQLPQRLYFNGTGNFVKVPNYPATSFGIGNFTLEAVIALAPMSPANSSPIISTFEEIAVDDTTRHCGILLNLDPSGKLELSIFYNVRQTFTFAEGPDLRTTTGQFKHVAVSRQGTIIKFYIDGVLVKTFTAATTVWVPNTNNLNIGGAVILGGYRTYVSKGYVQQVNIWNVARTDAQIYANSTRCITTTQTGLIASFQMDEGSGQVLANKAPNYTSYPGYLGFNSSTEPSSDPTWTGISTKYGGEADLTITSNKNPLCAGVINKLTVSGNSFGGYTWSLQSPGTLNQTNINAADFTPTGNNTPVLYLTGNNSQGCRNTIVNVFTKANFSLSGISNINSVTSDPSNILYGVSSEGGSLDYGTIYQYDKTAKVITHKQSFTGEGVGKNGSYPESYLTKFNGKLYGITSSGGQFNGGTLFEWDPNTNVLTTKVHFGNNGYSPCGHLTEYSGRLYGLTSGGSGANQYGVVYEWNPAVPNTTTVLASFNLANGAYPGGSLRVYNGKFYGTTSSGGTYGKGTLFTLGFPNPTITTLVHFDGATKGSYPVSNDVVLNNGKLYGTTPSGGSNGQGVIYEYNISTNVFTKKIDFGGTKGSMPKGMLTYFSNKFYGLTYTRDPYITAPGTLFEWDPVTNNFAIEHNFDFELPQGSLTLSGGKLYGTAFDNSAGLVFEWDPINNIYSRTSSDWNKGKLSGINLNLIEGYQGGNICRNDGYTRTYTANANPGLQGVYNWTIPTGATLLSGQNTSQIKVNFPYFASSGNITVAASNTCGTTNTVVYPITITDCYVIGSGTNPRIDNTEGSLDDVTLENLDVYPNPSSGLIYFKLNMESAQVLLIDLMGREVLNKEVNSANEYSLDLSAQAKGLYVLKIKGTNFSKLITLE